MKSDISMPDTETDDIASVPGEQAVIFCLHDEFFCFHISVINEIIEVPQINKVPRTPEFLAGAINYHGRIVGVINIARFFNLPSQERGALARVIVLVPDDYSLGFLVDSIKGISFIPEGGKEENPIKGDAFKSSYIERVVSIDDKLINVINIKKLLSDLEDYFKEVEIEH